MRVTECGMSVSPKSCVLQQGMQGVVLSGSWLLGNIRSAPAVDVAPVSRKGGLGKRSQGGGEQPHSLRPTCDSWHAPGCWRPATRPPLPQAQACAARTATCATTWCVEHPAPGGSQWRAPLRPCYPGHVLSEYNGTRRQAGRMDPPLHCKAPVQLPASKAQTCCRAQWQLNSHRSCTCILTRQRAYTTQHKG